MDNRSRSTVVSILFRSIVRAVIFALAVCFCYAVYERTSLSREFQNDVPLGSAMSEAQDKMSSKGFVCSRTSDKWGADEIFCLKKERIGLGLTSDFSRFLVALLPNEIYWVLPKNIGGSGTYKREEVTFVLERGLVQNVRAEVRLTPQ